MSNPIKPPAKWPQNSDTVLLKMIINKMKGKERPLLIIVGADDWYDSVCDMIAFLFKLLISHMIESLLFVMNQLSWILHLTGWLTTGHNGCHYTIGSLNPFIIVPGPLIEITARTHIYTQSAMAVWFLASLSWMRVFSPQGVIHTVLIDHQQSLNRFFWTNSPFTGVTFIWGCPRSVACLRAMLPL
jgi:hypothetical protein